MSDSPVAASRRFEAKTLSVVVPCYNEEEALPLFYKRACEIAAQMPQLAFEFILVDDGSKDGTLAVMQRLHDSDPRVHYISFSRNFGKEAALYAGLENVHGELVTVMDADLQDPPELLIEMYDLIMNEGWDCVATRRATREGEPKLRSFFARMFYKLMNKISSADIVDGARDFRMMKRVVCDTIVKMNEYNRFSKGIFGWVGFKTKWLSYDNIERVAGKTKWSFWKLFLYSLEGIFAFSTAPLSFAALLGIVMCVAALVFVVVIVVKTLVWGEAVAGYPSLACMIMFIGGVQLFCIGILGQYVAKTYLETKRRPIYIIREQE